MTHTLIIKGQLPCANDFIKACNSHRQVGAKLKRETERIIAAYIWAQLKGVRIDNPVMMHYSWYEPNKKRDKSNIAFAKKFLEDSLISCGVLKGDGWRYVHGFTDFFTVDKVNPRVEVVIREVILCKQS